MKNIPWFIGIDLGTGSCKSIVVDEQAGVLGFGVGEYSGIDAQDRWREQDPQDLLNAAVDSVRRAVAEASVNPGYCAGLSIGGALHSLLALDRHDNPLTGVITWADDRAARQSQEVKKPPLASQIYEETGCPVHGMYPLYKIMWLRDERPDVFRQALRYVSAKEYVFSCLTGEYLVDYSLAAGSGLLNTHSLKWNALCLDLANIREERLSSLCSPLTIHTGLKPGLARRMGIPSEVPIVLGSSDAVNSSLGAGAVYPWQATCMVGTSGALRVISPRPILDERTRSWCYAVDESHWLVGGAINNGGVALSWLKDCLNKALPHLKTLSFEDILALAGQVKAGAGGVVCLPFFAGERSPNWNLNARAVFFGMTLEHDGRHLARSLLEGIAFRFKNLHGVLAEIGVEIKQVIASGGFTKSDLWLQVVSDALNRELIVPEWGETSALGAALWAMLAAGRAETLEGAADFVKQGDACLPDPENAKIYERIYPLYGRLYEDLKAAFNEVTELQQWLKK
ncbi:MAG: gluconokinase [Deltaproteobacteria bacterium]|nr:gluconokinase [Deltaproteobacteria bacterium]